MGNLDFLNNKSSSIVIATTVEEISALAQETANCLPSLSITTIYSKLGLTTTNVGDKINVSTNCAVRISSDVNFTPNATGKVYALYGIEEQFVETDFNVVNFANGTVYTYTKGNISAADDPAPCIIIPKTFTDSESSAVFEKGVYLGAGIFSGGQTFYTKFEQKIDKTSIKTSIKISGKGFTSPQKPYRYISRPFEPDDDICIGINLNKMPSTDEEKSKGFNLFCDIKNPNIETSIYLNEDLASVIKHCRRGSLSIMIYEEDFEGLSSVEMDSNIFASLEVFPDAINGINGLSISFHEETVYFNPNISEDDYNSWLEKYLFCKP